MLISTAIIINAKATTIQFWDGMPRNVNRSVSQSCKAIPESY